MIGWEDDAGARPDPEVVREVRAEVSERLAAWVRAEQTRTGSRPPRATERAYAQSVIGDVLDERSRAAIESGQRPLEVAAERAVRVAVDSGLFGFGAIQSYLDDPEVENIFVNGCDHVFVRRAGGHKVAVRPVAETDEELIELVRRQAATAGRTERRFDRGSPRLSLRLADGSRLFAAMEVAVRPSLTIRRHRYQKVTLDDLIGLGTVDSLLRGFLGAAVRARTNVVIAGATDTGKTTMLRALIAEIDPDERLVVIEDNAELDLEADSDAHRDVVSLEQREPNVEGEGFVSMAALTRDALRMSPDRVLVGEARGDEVMPMLLAMSQGNDGSMCTVHADSSTSTFDRLALYAAMAPEALRPETAAKLIANSLHLVVFLTKVRSGVRVVSSVREVRGADGAQVISNEVFATGEDGRARPAAALSPSLRARLSAEGFDPSLLVHKEGFWT